jgi:hypothetical protein
MYSDDARNPGQLPQMLVFVGTGQAITLGTDGFFNSDDIIIAFEDLNRMHGADDDFNDLLVLVENVQLGPPPVTNTPEPASILAWSVLAGVGGIASWRRSRKRGALAPTGCAAG